MFVFIILLLSISNQYDNIEIYNAVLILSFKKSEVQTLRYQNVELMKWCPKCVAKK